MPPFLPQTFSDISINLPLWLKDKKKKTHFTWSLAVGPLQLKQEKASPSSGWTVGFLTPPVLTPPSLIKREERERQKSDFILPEE